MTSSSSSSDQFEPGDYSSNSLHLPPFTDIVDLARMIHMLPVTYDDDDLMKHVTHTAISGQHIFEIMKFDISQSHPEINKLRKQLMKTSALECSFPSRRSKDASDKSKYLIRFKPPFQVTSISEIVHTIYSRARDKWRPDPKPDVVKKKSTSGLTVTEREELLQEEQRLHLAKIKAGGVVADRPEHLPRRDGVNPDELNFLYYNCHYDLQKLMNQSNDILTACIPFGIDKGVVKYKFLLYPNFPKCQIPTAVNDFASRGVSKSSLASMSSINNLPQNSFSKHVTKTTPPSLPLRQDLINMFHDISIPGQLPGSINFDSRDLEGVMHASHLPILKYAKSKAQMENELYSDETTDQRRKRVRRDDNERRQLRKLKRTIGI